MDFTGYFNIQKEQSLNNSGKFAFSLLNEALI